MANALDYRKICFVIMPFGEKEVVNEKGEQRTVDFDAIYDGIFEPALRAVTLPEGGSLVPRRTDSDFFSGSISQEMFEYLEYSRMALADITGLNPNVFYELGVRHRARQAGTAIFRQLLAKIPFDINQIKAFPYEYEPADHARDSAALITRVVTESLEQNRMDSPVQLALHVQRHEHSFIEDDLRDAENALRVGDRAKAIAAYTKAAAEDPGNNLVHLRRGLLLKDLGNWEEALDAFNQAVAMAPGYAEAHREKGIAENKLFHRAGRPAGMPDGLAALGKAVELNPDDYDAFASLGGALKRAGQSDRGAGGLRPRDRGVARSLVPAAERDHARRPAEGCARHRRKTEVPPRTRREIAPRAGGERAAVRSALELLRPRAGPPVRWRSCGFPARWSARNRERDACLAG